MLIAVINQSTLISDDQANSMCQAVQIQLTSHVLPAWNQQSGTITFYADQTLIPAGAWIVSILDNTTQAGALGYHSEDNDVVDGFIFAQPVLDNGGVVLYDSTNPQNISVSSVLSHEICEMVGDYYVNFWADGPGVVAADGQTYTEYALELCDPVEANSYTIDLGDGTLVLVSNFVLPTWFNPQAQATDAPFDYLQLLSVPFSMTPGGYMIVRQSGNIQQIFGWKVSPEKKAEVKSEWYRR